MPDVLKLAAAHLPGRTSTLMRKDSAPQDLLQAIRDVAQGASTLHPQIAHN